MDNHFEVISFQLVKNSDILIHSLDELSLMANKNIISQQSIQWNLQLQQFLKGYSSEEKIVNKQKEKKLMKQLNKMNVLNEIDRMAILNNDFKNEAEIILKIDNGKDLSNKEKQLILEHSNNM